MVSKKEKQILAKVKNPKATILSQKTGYDFKGLGKFRMDEIRIEIDLHEGGKLEIDRVLFNRGHSVAVLPYDPVRNKVVLVSEMRPGILAAGEDPYDAQVSAGMIDPGESARKAGRREGQEELGTYLKLLKIFNKGAFVSPGGTTEKIALGIAVIDSSKIVHGSVHGKAEEGENIKTIKMNADTFIKRAMTGKVKDMKTLVCAFYLALNREKLDEQYGAPEETKRRNAFKIRRIL